MSEFDAYKDSYAKQINQAIRFSGQNLDFFTKAKCDIIVGRSAALLGGRASRVLDVGCGHGLIHRFLKEAMPEAAIHGIDIASSVIDEAKKNNEGIDYSVFDGKNIPFDRGVFDIAYTICVLHHVPPHERLNLLKEMFRAVRPGGLVIVIEHNPLNPLTQYIVKTCPLDENAILLWPGEVKRMIRKNAGLNTYLRFFLFTPFSARPFRLLDRALAFLPIGAQYYYEAKVPSPATSTLSGI